MPKLRKLGALLLLLCCCAAAQNPNTAVFPGGVATDNDLLVASNLAATQVTTQVASGDTTINVQSTSAFLVPTTITFGDTGEIAKCLGSTPTSFTSCTRGFDGAAKGVAAAGHASGVAVRGNAVAYYINQHAAELKAIEAAAAGALVNPMTTLGDTLYENATPAAARLAGNTAATKKFLTQTGTGIVSAAPVWTTIQIADVPTLNQSTSGNAATATALASAPTCTGCSNIKTITSIDASGNLTPVAIQLAAADGTTLGIAAFVAADFNATGGLISLDYANGQKATSGQPGFLTSTDWSTFNGKQAAGNYMTALTGDVSAAGPGSSAATLVNIPTGVTQAGYILQSGLAAPGAGATGKGRFYFDSTSLNMAVVNAAGTVNHGVQTKASAAHNWLTSINDAGAVGASQPDYSDLTGTPTLRYQTVAEEGSSLTQRATVNFIGPGACADNSGSARTDCTFPNHQLTMGIGAGDIGTTGTKACSTVRWAGTILGVYLTSNALPTGANLQVDILKVAGASYTGVASATSITASDIPAIATGASNPIYTDTTLTGWTTSIAVGDVVCVAVKTAPTGGATNASLTLEVK